MRKFILFLTVLISLSTTAAAQKAVTGKVVDEKDGNPIVGASIRVKMVPFWVLPTNGEVFLSLFRTMREHWYSPM